MKKNKLIELLQKIEGNPEIYLWNGFVGDWCDIDGKFVENELVKETLEHKLSCLEGEWCRDNNNTFEIPDDVKISLTNLAEKQFKAQQWEFPNQWVDSNEFNNWYGKHKKRIVIINHKERGKTYWDRMGGYELLMNRKNTIRYIHPVVGEIYLDKNTKAFELYQEKDFKKLDEAIATEYKKCYNDLVPVIQR